jgi:hypothetical protein
LDGATTNGDGWGFGEVFSKEECVGVRVNILNEVDSIMWISEVYHNSKEVGVVNRAKCILLNLCR